MIPGKGIVLEEVTRLDYMGHFKIWGRYSGRAGRKSIAENASNEM